MTKFYEVVDGILVDILIVFLRFTVPMVVFFFVQEPKDKLDQIKVENQGTQHRLIIYRESKL